MKEGKIMALAGILGGLQFIFIPMPFSLATIGVTVMFTMLGIHLKQKARIAKNKMTEGWDVK